MIDNHIYWGNALGIDNRRIAWRRVMDMNDRALRQIVYSLGGVANGFPREDGFDITVASEVMAIFCLASDLEDLKKRLGNIIVAYTRDRKPVRAQRPQGARRDDGAAEGRARRPIWCRRWKARPPSSMADRSPTSRMAATRCSATTTALKLADYVVTEAGFGADLGGEKFLDIKCRKAGLEPYCAVLVATIRALKMHGGVKKEDLKTENLKALEAGMTNLARHVENMQKFGIAAGGLDQPLLGRHRRRDRSGAEECKALGVEAFMADHWAMGGEGAADVARAVAKIMRRAARAS